MKRIVLSLVLFFSVLLYVATGVVLGLYVGDEIERRHSPPKPELMARERLKNFYSYLPGILVLIVSASVLLVVERRYRFSDNSGQRSVPTPL